MVRAYGGEVVGVVQALNREEVGQDGLSSTVNEIESLIGEGRVLSILKMRELMVWLEKDGQAENLAKMQEYWDQYGLK
jgi:orotate phosphoribosyltransferase